VDRRSYHRTRQSKSSVLAQPIKDRTHLVFQQIEQSSQPSLATAFAVTLAQVPTRISDADWIFSGADLTIISVKNFSAIFATTPSKWIVNELIVPYAWVSGGRPRERIAMVSGGGCGCGRRRIEASSAGRESVVFEHRRRVASWIYGCFTRRILRIICVCQICQFELTGRCRLPY
jgi:hypothetical protein